MVFMFPSGLFTEKIIAMNDLYVELSGSMVQTFSLFDFRSEKNHFNLTIMSNLFNFLPLCSPLSEPLGSIVIDSKPRK